MEEIVTRLHKAGYVVSLVSNTYDIHAKSNELRGFYKLFDNVFLSNEIGLIKPDVKKYFLVCDDCSDWESISEKLRSDFGLTDLSLDFPLDSVDSDSGMTFTVWDGREVIRVEPGDVKSAYGVALDIGTTTVAAYLCDLNTGEIVSTDTVLNPQVMGIGSGSKSTLRSRSCTRHWQPLSRNSG